MSQPTGSPSEDRRIRALDQALELVRLTNGQPKISAVIEDAVKIETYLKGDSGADVSNVEAKLPALGITTPGRK